jgi:lactoylglutathione lyase
MKFAYTIIFVEDVEQTVVFYEQAFGFTRQFVSPDFAQLATGEVALAFGANRNERRELPADFTYHQNILTNEPAGMQISLVTEDVEAAFGHAVAAGAIPVIAPNRQPWGQTVSRVRDCNGVLVGIVSPFRP